MEHHVVAEALHGARPVYPEYHTHHIDGDKSNNAPSNIQVMTAEEHNAANMWGDDNPMRKYPEKNHFRGKDQSGANNGRWRSELTDPVRELREQGMSHAAIAKKLNCSKYAVATRLGYKRPEASNHTVVSVEYLDDEQDVYCGTVKDAGKFFVVNADNEGVLVSNCGEQPLPPNGACLLGSFNLVEYLVFTEEGEASFDWAQFKEDIPHVVRAMDNVVDRAVYPLPAQEEEAKQKRRMGLGITAAANAGETLGFPYGSPEFLGFLDDVMGTLKNEAYRASALLAKEKGSFPLYDKVQYKKGRFIKTLDEDVQKLIAKHGIRNSHLISVAPTGTISLSADNVSSGIEPVFAHEYTRAIQTQYGPTLESISDYAYREFGVKGKTSSELTAGEHLAVLATAQKHVDSAVSKTCNVSPDMDWEEFKQLYFNAWEMGCKGITTFNSGGKRMGILVASEEDDDAAACWINPDGSKSCE